MADAPTIDRPDTSPPPVRRDAPPKADRLPPYRVLLHNDDHNDMVHVVLTIAELVTMPRVRAVTVMMTAHTNGCALLTVTHKERAELYVEQFRSKGLTVSIEPDA